MAFTFVLSEDVGKVRLMIPDSKEATYLFEDEEIEAFLTIEGESLKLATALALETIASNEALVLKVIRTLDIATDGAKVSDALLKRAKALRDQVDSEEAKAGGGFEIAELVTDTFTWRERLAKQSLRDEL